MPEEFLNCFTSVDDKELTTVYDVLRTFREGNSLKKTDDSQISIKQFISDPDYPKKVEAYYNGLKNTMNAPEELSLPYSTNSNERKKALVSRVCRNNDLLDLEKAAYRLVRGFYVNRYLEYPFAIEALAIPYKKTAFRIGGNIQYKV